MKTSKKISLLSRRNKLIILILLFALAIFLLSIILHVTPLGLFDKVSNFAVHHYFLSGFIAFLIISICLKFYFSNNKEIDALKNEKSKYFQNKAKQRKNRIQAFKNGIAVKLFNLKKKVNNSNKIVLPKHNLKDVLNSNEEVKVRQQNLNYAMKLSNTLKHKVKLHYKESNLSRCIETVILYVNNEHVTVTGGIILPVRSIYKVEI